MKIRRHVGRDMRQALRAVREELGSDAVILSTRTLPDGVEVVAAMDFDVEAVTQAAAQRPAAEAPADFQALLARASAPPASAPAPAPAVAAAEVATPAAASAADRSSESLGQELKALRRVLETQLAQLAWNDFTRRAPLHAELVRELTEIGFGRDLVTQVVRDVPEGTEYSAARRLVIGAIAQRLPVTGDRWLDCGGRIAFVGPTGVGKTTAIAKIAARWVLRHGPRELALVSTDTVRIGASEQIQALARLLGVPVYTLEDYESLPALLDELAGRRLVLIDTPGSSQRDAQLASRLAALAGSGPRVETTLVVSASTQAGAVQETLARFAPAGLSSCLVTKLDEAASLGGVLSALAERALPIAYVSDGQRVPEDLRPARSLDLVVRAVQLAEGCGASADEELLGRRFGEVAREIA